METFFAIVASVAVIPVVGLLAYFWYRFLGERYGTAIIELLTIGLFTGPPFIFLVACFRYCAVRAGLFKPDVPSNIAEVIWLPVWTGAIFGTMLLAARRAFSASRNARPGDANEDHL